MRHKLIYLVAIFMTIQRRSCERNADINIQQEGNVNVDNGREEGYLFDLEVSLEGALISCRRGMDSLLESLLNDDNENPPGDLMKFEDGNYEEFDQEFDFVRDFQFPMSSIPNYATDLQNLLNSMEDACLALSKAVPALNKGHRRNVESKEDRVKKSLEKWVMRWGPYLNEQVNKFLNSCLRSVECEQILEQLFDGVLSIMDMRTFKGFHYFGGSFAPPQSSFDEPPPPRDIASEALSKLQSLALKFEEKFGLDGNREESFWIAEKFSEETNLRNENNRKVNQIVLPRQTPKGKNKINGELEIETEYLAAEVPETFLSVALGSRLIQDKWKHIPQKRERFLNMASNLSPAMMRMGGSASNFLYYDPNHRRQEKGGIKDSEVPFFHPKMDRDVEKNSIQDLRFFYHPKFNPTLTQVEDDCQPQYETKKDFTNFTMSENDWHFLLSLTKDLKWTLLFDLNQFTRDEDGRWDPTNAKQIMNDAMTSSVPIIWQLGNEPNSYKHNFGFEITPDQAAQDYKTLRGIINENDEYFGTKTKLVGPDVTRPRNLEEYVGEKQLGGDALEYLNEFLNKSQVLDAVTWHQYYVNGREATLEDFTSTKLMDRFPLQLEEIVSLRDQEAPHKPIWMTETATAWGGGAQGLSNSFAGSFIWLDKLGAAALGGVSNIFRQSLYGGCYGFLEQKEMQPIPAYWISVLHKQTAGKGVLLPRTRLIAQDVRIYAHCLNTKYPLYEEGAIMIFGLNVGSEKEEITLVGDQLETSPLFAYRFSSPNGDLTSKKISLNGKTLQAFTDGSLPPMFPDPMPTGVIEFYPGEVAFWILPKANISLC